MTFPYIVKGWLKWTLAQGQGSKFVFSFVALRRLLLGTVVQLEGRDATALGRSERSWRVVVRLSRRRRGRWACRCALGHRATQDK